MVYALAITIAAALVILAAIAVVAYLARRSARQGGLGGWRFYPSPWLLLVLPLVIAAVIWRFVPGLLILPFVFPFALRGRGLWFMRQRRVPRERSNGHHDDGAIEGQYRYLDEN